jgi:RNA polymerase sigma factor (sigma-70 family)
MSGYPTRQPVPVILDPARTALAEKYLEFTLKQASTFKRKYPRMDLAELQSAATLGLMQAVWGWRADKAAEAGARFETYAYMFIEGRMIDEVRIAARSRTSRARAELAKDAVAGIDDTPVRGFFRAFSVVLMSELVRADADNASGFEPSTDPQTGEPLVAGETREAVRKVMEQLNTDERQVVELKYAGCLSDAEIARFLGIHRANVARRHEKALAHVRELLLKQVPGLGVKLSTQGLKAPV